MLTVIIYSNDEQHYIQHDIFCVIKKGARYTKETLYKEGNHKFLDVPCDSKQAFICSANLGDTDLAITTENVAKFVEYVQRKNANDRGKYISFILLIE